MDDVWIYSNCGYNGKTVETKLMQVPAPRLFVIEDGNSFIFYLVGYLLIYYCSLVNLLCSVTNGTIR